METVRYSDGNGTAFLRGKTSDKFIDCHSLQTSRCKEAKQVENSYFPPSGSNITQGSLSQSELDLCLIPPSNLDNAANVFEGSDVGICLCPQSLGYRGEGWNPGMCILILWSIDYEFCWRKSYRCFPYWVGGSRLG